MFRRFLTILFAWFDLAGSVEARTLIAVHPPDLGAAKAPLLREFGDLLMKLPLGERLIVYGARGPLQLATTTAPDDPRAANAAWRRRKLAEAFAPVARYIAEM